MAHSKTLTTVITFVVIHEELVTLVFNLKMEGLPGDERAFFISLLIAKKRKMNKNTVITTVVIVTPTG